MNIDISLIGQMLTFLILVAFTMRFVWPPVVAAMEARRQKIADGLAAAEQGEHKLQLAKEEAKQLVQDGKDQAAKLVDQAEKRCQQLLDQAKVQAKTEGDRIINAAQAEIERQYREAQVALKNQLADHAVAIAQKVLSQGLDEQAQAALLGRIVTEVEAIQDGRGVA